MFIIFSDRYIFNFLLLDNLATKHIYDNRYNRKGIQHAN